MPRKLEDVDVQFVSLVKKAANKKRFAIYKSAEAKFEEVQEMADDKSAEVRRVEIMREAQVAVEKQAEPAKQDVPVVKQEDSVEIEKAAGARLLKEYMGIEDKAWREVEKAEDELSKCEKACDEEGIKKAKEALASAEQKFKRTRKARRMHEDAIATMKAAQTYLDEKAGEGNSVEEISKEKTPVMATPTISKTKEEKSDIAENEEEIEDENEDREAEDERAEGVEKKVKKGEKAEMPEIADTDDEEDEEGDEPMRKLKQSRARLRAAKMKCEDVKKSFDAVEENLSKAMDAGDDGLFERARNERTVLKAELDKATGELERAVGEYENLLPRGIVENPAVPSSFDAGIEDAKSIALDVIDGSGEFEVDETGQVIRVISSSPQAAARVVKFDSTGSFEIMKSAIAVNEEKIAGLVAERDALKARLEKREKHIQRLEKSDAVPTPRSARPDAMVSGTGKRTDAGAGWGNGIDYNMETKVR